LFENIKWFKNLSQIPLLMLSDNVKDSENADRLLAVISSSIIIYTSIIELD